MNSYKKKLIISIFIIIIINGCCSGFIKNNKKQDNFSIECMLIDFQIPGACSNEINSGIFLFQYMNNEKLDSLLVIIPCPNEDFFKIGTKYGIKYSIDRPNYVPIVKSYKFEKLKIPIYYSTMSWCKRLKIANLK